MRHAAAAQDHSVLTVVLIVGMVCLIFILASLLRRRPTSAVHVTISAYFLLLMTCFAFGMFTDDGFGWAYLPGMIAAAPWALMSTLLPRWLQNLVGRGLFENFIFLVVLCGGINSSIFLLLSRFLTRRGSESMPTLTRS